MRPWIEHLITHAGAYADFVDYIESAESNLNFAMHKHLIDNEMDKAKLVAAELNAYKGIKQGIRAAYRERQSQIQYQESIKK